jgi:hypothetical protein
MISRIRYRPKMVERCNVAINKQDSALMKQHHHESHVDCATKTSADDRTATVRGKERLWHTVASIS